MRQRNIAGVNSLIVTDGGSVSMHIVSELSGHLGCDPTEIEPLANSIDPDALDTIVTSSDDVTVSFDHAGCTIRVEGQRDDISVHITPSSERTD